jgi:hypothetical protein
MTQNIVNLDRDMQWIGEPVDLTTGSEGNLGTNPAVVTDGTVYVKHGFVEPGVKNLAGTSGQFVTFGVQMLWSEAGPTPYRVIGSSNVECYWGFGWDASGGATVSGLVPRYPAFAKQLDACWCIRERDSWASHNLVFFARVAADAGQWNMSLSVQSMLPKPDQYSAQVR